MGVVKRTGPTGFKLWAFRGSAILLPFVLLALIEIAFRIAGVAEPEPLFIEVRTPAQHKFQTNPNVASRDFPTALARIMPSPGFQAFDVQKPEGMLRVFCLGASTTAGFPLPQHLSYPAILQEKLRMYLPERWLEVINCGMSAVASFTLVDFTKEVLRHEADLVVVYTGHNEFYGAWGAASTAGPGGAPGWSLRPLRWLQRLRMWKWLSSRLEEPKIEPGTLMERMVARPAVDPSGALHRGALKDYRGNIRKMIRLCRKADVPVVFCEPVSNLRNCYPFGTLMPGDLSEAEERRLELWKLERQVMDKEVTAVAAHDRWRELIREDSTSADLWFHGGALGSRARRWEETAAAYVKARDWDTVHFRACSEFIDALRQVCREEDVPLVPLVERFQQATTGAVPGNDLFVEHVHPSLRGQILVADAICDILQGMRWPDSATVWDRDADPGPWLVLHMAGLTPLDARFADLRIEQLKHRWPYTNPLGMELTAGERFLQADPLRHYRSQNLYDESYELWRTQMESLSAEDTLVFEEKIEWPSKPDTVISLVARRALEEDGNIHEGHRQLAKHYNHERRWAETFQEYRSAARLFPVDAESFYNAGQALMKGRYFERARNYYLQALALSPGRPAVMAVLGDVELRLGRPDVARAWAERVLAVDPKNKAGVALMERLDEHKEQP